MDLFGAKGGKRRWKFSFWSTVLSYDGAERNTDELLVSDPAGHASLPYFMKRPEPKSRQESSALGPDHERTAGRRSKPTERTWAHA